VEFATEGESESQGSCLSMLGVHRPRAFRGKKQKAASDETNGRHEYYASGNQSLPSTDLLSRTFYKDPGAVYAT
jgi:hypothetical protein